MQCHAGWHLQLQDSIQATHLLPRQVVEICNFHDDEGKGSSSIPHSSPDVSIRANVARAEPQDMYWRMFNTTLVSFLTKFHAQIQHVTARGRSSSLLNRHHAAGRTQKAASPWPQQVKPRTDHVDLNNRTESSNNSSEDLPSLNGRLVFHSRSLSQLGARNRRK